MLLAELEVFQSRPIAPTRRLSIGITVLPSQPAPGFGGLLLGGIVARYVPELDGDLLPGLSALVEELDRGQRIPQPRLRYRLQDDRVGLSSATHRLIGTGEELRYEIAEAGKAEPHVLAAVYAAGRLPAEARGPALTAIRKAIRWPKGPGPALIDHLSDARGTAGWATLGGRDPLVWALGVLELPATEPTREVVQRQFRTLLRAAHPDHGADAEVAAARIRELTEARRILLR